MGLINDIEEIAEDICAKYCKYPEQYEQEFDDSDETYEKMFKEKCENCPLNKL